MSKLYRHNFVHAFSFETRGHDASNIPGAVLRAAILSRLSHLPDDELEEAVGTAESTETFEVQP